MISLDEPSLRMLLRAGESQPPLEAKLAELLGEVLSRGETVHLTGIGTLAAGADGRLRVSPSPRPRVFLAYVVEDQRQVRSIFRFLKGHGFEPWMDEESLLPGQNWPRAIERAIEGADFVIPCFSRVSTSKRSFFHAELRIALDCARLRPLDTAYLVPIRIEPCPVPRSIQKHTQYVDLFPDPDPGLEKLLRTLRGG